jgi:hypothetical protein
MSKAKSSRAVAITLAILLALSNFAVIPAVKAHSDQLTNVVVKAVNIYVSQNSTYWVNFTATSSTPANRINITFPAGYDLSGVTASYVTVYINDSQQVSEVLVSSTNRRSLNITLGTTFDINDNIAVCISNKVKNPSTANSYSINVYTATSSTGALIDSGTCSVTLSNPWLSVSPTSADRGAIVTVSGGGFNSSETVSIYFDSAFQKNVVANEGGNITATIAVPSTASYGKHTISVIGQASGLRLSSTFYVTRLVISPISGYVGDTLTVEGWGFNASQYARIYFDVNRNGIMESGELKAIALVDSEGHFLTALAVPEACNGTHVVKAVQAPTTTTETSAWYASAVFTVLPKIWLSPTSGPSGMTVKVYGNGFSAGAPNVTIYFDKNKNGVMDPDERLPKSPKTLETTSTGTFASPGYFTFVVPSVAYGSYAVWVNDTNGVRASATFTVGPASITLTPSTGIVGATINIAGAGFTPGATITVRIGTTTVSEWVVAPTVRTDGTFSGTFYVPVLRPGAYTVNATDNSVWATAPFSVPTPVISLNRTSGPVGIGVRITGSNFANGTAGYSIKVYLKNATWSMDITLIPVSVTKTGSISANITIPLATSYPYPGIYMIMVNASKESVYSEVYAVQNFEVLASRIILSKSSGVAGEWIDVVGLNFYPGNTITFKIAGTTMLTTPSTVKANATGGFACKVQIPSTVAPGSYVIAANGTTFAGGSNRATATFTVGSFETIIVEKLDEIEAKLDVGGAFYTFVNNWFTSIQGTLNQVKAKVENIDWNDVTAIKEAVSLISGKLGPLNPGDTIAGLLYDIKDAAASIENRAGTIMDKLSAVEAKIGALSTQLSSAVTTITGAVDSAKSDIISAIKGNTTAVLSAISSAKQDVLTAISGLEAKLGTFTNTDTVASLLYDIKDAVASIENSVVGMEVNVGEILSAVSDVKAKLEDETYGLAAIKSAISGLSDQISNAVSAINAVGSDVAYIKSKIDAMTAAQAASGSGSAVFTSSRAVVVYQGSKVGTVTVTFKTVGVSSYESLTVRYYLDPSNPSVYAEKTVASGVDVRGWTDTAAAWKVEIAYTWRSGTDTVYWSYSVVSPP